ncbi:MAG: endo-1,4-beta-xylanase [Treponema sp.]|jgi:endo-1,4-beta-xylanase|nr:endo-1,4-beta-xylanase [Treponema sp.]
MRVTNKTAAVLAAALVFMGNCDSGRPVSTTGASVPAGREDFAVSRSHIFSEDFEDMKSSLRPRGQETLSIVPGAAQGGNYCLLAANRKASWNGPMIPVGGKVLPLRRYDVEAWVRYGETASSVTINCGFEINGSAYYTCGFAPARAGKWTKLEGTFVFPADTAAANLYFESSYTQSPGPEDLADIFIDDLVISEVAVTGSAAALPPLWAEYEDYFSIGTAIGAYEARIPAYAEVAARHFNSVTMGNEMKPDYVLDYAKCSSDPEKYELSPAIRTDTLDAGLRFARDQGLKLRVHTLVWHEQTPSWFFRERYSADPGAPLASRELMLARMENYIRQVLTYCQENYPGVVYCADVVNEAIEPSHRNAGNPGSIRTAGNLWYQTVGPDYVEWAFTFARKYAAEGIKLFYNDYNCYNYTKLLAIYNLVLGLYEKGLIDGVGMQGHIGMEEPTVTDLQYAVTKLGGIGLEIQITELDINLAGGREEDLAELASRYKRLMTTLRFIKERSLANITNVTVWGLTDDGSWLNNASGPKYPLLFDKYLRPKEAFFGFALDDSVPLNRIRR